MRALFGWQDQATPVEIFATGILDSKGFLPWGVGIFIWRFELQNMWSKRLFQFFVAEVAFGLVLLLLCKAVAACLMMV